MPRRWPRSPSWRMPWHWARPCRHPAAAGAGSSTAGCAGRARRPSSVARCWRGRRSAWGLDVIVGLQALLLGAAAGAACLVPELRHAHRQGRARRPVGCAGCCGCAVSPAGAGGRPRPGQPRHARRLCGDPLARGRREPGDGECALVGVRGRGGARSSSARRS